MNPQEDPNWQQKLKDLEAELYQTTPLAGDKSSAKSRLSELVTQFQGWLQQLSPPLRIVVIGGSVLVVFSILNALLKLATALISLTVLAVLIYLGYRFLTGASSNSNNSQKH